VTDTLHDSALRQFHWLGLSETRLSRGLASLHGEMQLGLARAGLCRPSICCQSRDTAHPARDRRTTARQSLIRLNQNLSESTILITTKHHRHEE
jgi:hypothetical protein